ncbi:MAG: GNAT family N-acetyltransferase [Clostridiales bacterium]|nr:GNAT family N-acetyltransferase [Clostridiales bacterium]
MQTRLLQPEDYPTARALWQARFGDAPVYLDFMFSRYIPETGTFGYGTFSDGGALLSMAFARPTAYMIDGRETPAVFIFSVATAEANARQGLMRKTVLALLLHASIATKARFALLRPAQIRYYESLGFRPATSAAEFRGCPSPREGGGELPRPINAGINAYLRAHRLCLLPYNFAAPRREMSMRLHIAEVEADGGHAEFLRLSETQGAYVLYHIRENHIDIDELAAPKEYIYSILEYLYSKHNKPIHASLPPDMPGMAPEQVQPQNLYLTLRAEFTFNPSIPAYSTDAYC